MEKISLYKRRDFQMILNDSTNFITQNFRTYAKGFLYFVVPPLLLFMGATVYLFFQMSDLFLIGLTPLANRPDAALRMFKTIGPIGLVIFLLGSTVYVVQSLLAYELILLYESKSDPRTITVQEMGARIKANILNMVGSYFGLVLAFIVAMIAAFIIAIVPFIGAIADLFGLIFMMIPISLYFIVRLRERTNILDAFIRCFQLNSGHWWRTFGLLIVVGIVAWFMQMLFVAPLHLLGYVFSSHDLGNFASRSSFAFALVGITQVVGIAASLFFSVISHIVIAFNYYSLAENTDHTGLLSEIETIGEAPDPAYRQEGEY